jgi:DnaK suppressor protein
MKTAEIEKFKVQLFQLKTELEELQSDPDESTKPVELDQARVGRLSRMDAMQVQAMAQETARRRQNQLTMIQGALRRIESGEYGYCCICGEEIDIRRLSVNPATTRCLACVEE